MQSAIEEGARTMTTKTTMTRTIRLAIGTAVALVLMTQAAQARPSGLNQRTGLPIVANVHTPATIPASPANNVAAAHAAVAAEHAAANVPIVPVQPAREQFWAETPPTQTVPAATNSGGFDWNAAGLGAGAVLAVALIGAAALAARGRRRIPLSA
jgi:hypothetical protein